MTRQRFNGLCVALVDKLHYNYNGEHIKGKTLSFYRDREHSLKAMADIAKSNNAKPMTSYDEAWEALKPARDCVGM